MSYEEDFEWEEGRWFAARWHFLDGGTRPCFPCPMGWCGFVIMGMGH